jgi:hypothetical protein
MVGFLDEELFFRINHPNPFIIAIPLEESLCDEPPGTCGTTVKQREKRAERRSGMHNMLYIQYLRIFRRVVMASEQVPVASQRVLMSRLPVPVAS